MKYSLEYWPSYSEDEWWRQWASESVGKLSLLAKWRHQPDDWRRLLTEQLERLLGWDESPADEPRVELLGQKDAYAFSLQKLAIEACDGTWMPGYVCVPHDNQKPLPAVVLVHDDSSSKEQMIGLLGDDRPDIAPAAYLAASGYVVCCLDRRGAGERTRSSDVDGLWQWLGKPSIGREASDMVMARRMLSTRPDVQEKRIGLLGIGSGGMTALYASILDNSFWATALCGCLMRFRSLPLQADPHRRQALYERLASTAVPGLLAYADFEDLACLIAPRALGLCQGMEDHVSPELAADVVARIVEGFEAMGENPKLTVQTEACPLRYPTTDVLTFLDDWLKLPA